MAYHNTLENLEIRHHRADERALDKLDRLMPKAEELIGELCREGRKVLYINLTTKDGRFTGKTREGSRADLIDYLIRNRYVI